MPESGYRHKTKKFRAVTAGNFSLLTNLIQTYEKKMLSYVDVTNIQEPC